MARLIAILRTFEQPGCVRISANARACKSCIESNVPIRVFLPAAFSFNRHGWTDAGTLLCLASHRQDRRFKPPPAIKRRVITDVEVLHRRTLRVSVAFSDSQRGGDPL